MSFEEFRALNDELNKSKDGLPRPLVLIARNCEVQEEASDGGPSGS